MNSEKWQQTKLTDRNLLFFYILTMNREIKKKNSICNRTQKNPKNLGINLYWTTKRCPVTKRY